jgi:hypothetical protein
MQDFAERNYKKLILAIWLLASCAILFISQEAIATWKMGDPDDQLRLIQVRDWVAGQSWWDITQYRMNAPDGGPMHWSRLVDIPLAGMIVLLTPWLGQALAEQATAAVIPLLVFGVGLAFYADTVRRLFGAMAAIVASGLIITIIPVMTQMVPMRIDHHGWQMVCFFAALWAYFDRHARWWSAATLGLACALWIEISIEGLPFAALLLGLLALRWMFPGLSPAPANETRQFPIALLSLALGSCLLFGVTESWSEANYCDALSPFHCVAFVAMAVVVLAGAMADRLMPTRIPLHYRGAVCALAGVAGLAAAIGLAPQCAGDAFAGLDPLVREYWYSRVPEGLPLWSVQLDFAIQQFAGLIAGGMALLYVILLTPRLSKSDKISVALLYVCLAAIGMVVGRTAVYALSVGNILLAVLLIDFFAMAERRTGLLPRMALRVLAVLLVTPNLLAQVVIDRVNAAEAVSDPATTTYNKNFEILARACQKTSAAAALDKLPTSQIMAGLDTSPAILQFTRHSVVATGHHRNQKAMADVIRTFVGSPEQAADIMSARNIGYLVMCDGSYELAIYQRKSRDGFLSQLRRGMVPAWLERQKDIGPFQIYRVDRTALQQHKASSQ